MTRASPANDNCIKLTCRTALFFCRYDKNVLYLHPVFQEHLMGLRVFGNE
jgi:hypothetical protein